MTDPGGSALLTDLYQLTMLQGYYDRGMEDEASFELFIRKLPKTRNYLIAAGLEQALTFLESFEFSAQDVDYLSSTGHFSDDFLGYLSALRFTGDVWAMPEGSVFFPDEPILRVTASLPEAQVVETRLINLLQFQTLIASKAARVRSQAGDALLVDFGLRRAHGAEAGLLAARASYLAGFTGSSTVLAGKEFGVPIFGTMAHSYIQAHEDEAQAFLDFARSHPDNVVLLIDTYDTLDGARKVVEVARELEAEGIEVKAVRLDSGDLLQLAVDVRSILDHGGLEQVGIFASGGLDEYKIRDLAESGAPITGYGVGTSMDVSEDAPYLNCAYKLVEYRGKGRMKRSEGKATWPGRKQVYRRYEDGVIAGDTICLQNEEAEGTRLLREEMKEGRRLEDPISLDDIRSRVRRDVASLPPEIESLTPSKPYPVEISPRLRLLADRIE
ncbi:MAG: nicotinate phosphoribosyltransferase [Rhodothermia bacterium]|nr:nicotinate phosphoribosyltransferase [Rhodothermia bacterium]